MEWSIKERCRVRGSNGPLDVTLQAVLVGGVLINGPYFSPLTNRRKFIEPFPYCLQSLFICDIAGRLPEPEVCGKVFLSLLSKHLHQSEISGMNILTDWPGLSTLSSCQTLLLSQRVQRYLCCSGFALCAQLRLLFFLLPNPNLSKLCSYNKVTGGRSVQP